MLVLLLCVLFVVCCNRLNNFSESYVDDMGVGSDSWCQHMVYLRQFLTVVREAGLTLNLKKCEFGKPEVKFVGHFVGPGGRRPNPQRLAGLSVMSRPQTKRDLRRLLGAIGYYRDYIDHFADIAKLLTDLRPKRFQIICHGRTVISMPLMSCVVTCAHLMCYVYQNW